MPHIVAFIFLAYCLVPVHADEEPLRFAVIGDMGCDCAGQEAIAEEMIEWRQNNPFSFVLTTGDNIYGDGISRFWNSRKGGDRALFAKKFDRYYDPLIKQGVLFFATLGNHDLETRQGLDLIEDRRRFNILSNTGYYYFSPDPDLVTFIALHTELILPRGGYPSQIRWLEKVLSESKSKWKIVYGHHPLYTPPGYHPVDVSLRETLEPLMVKYGVKIYLSGHNHFYARMKLQKGIVHFTTGGGGRHLKTPQRTSETDVIARAFHFMHFDLYEERADFWAVPIRGDFIDKGTIHR